MKDNETLLPVIFVTSDSNINYSLICKDTEIFTHVEYRLYEKFPEYAEFENYFIANDIKINRFKTLKDNHIKYSDIITMNPVEN